MSAALKIGQVRDQKLASPDLAVRPVPGAVEGHADHPSVEVILGHARDNVGVVMLHADLLHTVQFQRKTGTEVAGMEVVSGDARLYAEQLLHLLQRFLEEPQSFVVFEIADMLAEQGVAAFGQAERVLQSGPAGQHFGHLGAQVDGQRRVASRTAQYSRLALEGAHHGVVGTHINVAIVKQERIGDAGQPLARLVISCHDRLFAHIAAGHNQHAVRGAVEQKVVKRRVGQHDAQRVVARRDFGRNG